MAIGDSFVQIAPDSTGKRMETALVRTQGADSTTGTPIDAYRQRAELAGASQDALDQLLALTKRQVALLQAILTNLNSVSNLAVTEEDFPTE